MSNQIADIYTNLLDSFWKPYYTELGFQIKQYVASICYMACATNDGINKPVGGLWSSPYTPGKKYISDN